MVWYGQQATTCRTQSQTTADVKLVPVVVSATSSSSSAAAAAAASLVINSSVKTKLHSATEIYKKNPAQKHLTALE